MRKCSRSRTKKTHKRAVTPQFFTCKAKGERVTFPIEAETEQEAAELFAEKWGISAGVVVVDGNREFKVWQEETMRSEPANL